MCAAKGVWVLIEQQEERLRDGCLEVVGEGRKIADKLGDELTAVITGSISDEQINLLAQHGASRILSVEHPALNPYSVEIHAQILAEVIKQHTPDVVLAIDSINGADIACRVAARLGSGLVTACDRVDVNSERQLDESTVPLLFVVHLSLSLSLTDGETLPDIVGSLRKSLEDNTNALMFFNDRLLESGYLDQHGDNYSHRTYTLRELNVYKVKGEFPRITEKDIRNGVGDVHYTVSVAECRHFRVPLDDLVTLLKE